MNASVFQQREESGSRKISSSVQCTRPISQRAGIGTDEKLLLKKDWRWREYSFPQTHYAEYVCLFFFFKAHKFNYIVSVVLYMDALMILGANP